MSYWAHEASDEFTLFPSVIYSEIVSIIINLLNFFPQYKTKIPETINFLK